MAIEILKLRLYRDELLRLHNGDYKALRALCFRSNKAAVQIEKQKYEIFGGVPLLICELSNEHRICLFDLDRYKQLL